MLTAELPVEIKAPADIDLWRVESAQAVTVVEPRVIEPQLAADMSSEHVNHVRRIEAAPATHVCLDTQSRATKRGPNLTAKRCAVKLQRRADGGTEQVDADRPKVAAVHAAVHGQIGRIKRIARSDAIEFGGRKPQPSADPGPEDVDLAAMAPSAIDVSVNLESVATKRRKARSSEGERYRTSLGEINAVIEIAILHDQRHLEPGMAKI